jgi:hypothetical protein
MANWSQKKLLMTMGGLVLVVGGASAGGVYYTHGLIEAMGAQVTEKSQAIVVADNKIRKIPRLENEVLILRENLGEYVKILPDEQSLNDFLRSLQKFERQSGINGTGLKKKASRARRGKNKSPGSFTPIAYTYEMTATLWQALTFMNLIENFERFVSITEFSISRGLGNRGGLEMIEGEVVHSIHLTMQTYKYNNASKGEDVEIPNYEDRLDDLREEIWKRMQAIRIDRYEHPGMQGRRDVFVDPRESGVSNSNDPSNAEQRAILEKYVGAVSEMRGMQDLLSAKETTLFDQFKIRKRFKKTLSDVIASLPDDESLIVYRPYRLRWSQDVLIPLEEIEQMLAQAGPSPVPKADPYLPLAEIEELIEDMSNDCNSGQLEQARERYESVRDRLSVPVDDQRYDLAVSAKSWHHKASTAIDFKGLDLDVQGVVVNYTGRSGVLLNGEVFAEGDFVEEDLLVKQVEAEQVWFVFRGLTLVRTM